MLAAVGSAAFRSLARARYATDGFANEAETDAQVSEWLSTNALEPEAGSEVRADDEQDPHSLIAVLHARIGELRAPVRVEVRPGLSSVAAAGDGFVAIRPDARLSPEAALRIAHHELHAHVLPRLAEK